ncbi:HU domain-containing protein [Jiulongibacter sediminis]|uniref:SPOR domain-containing protein n=1 Tax=Jiulongibacter sediminis TaxID=1605367 RepID=A0A0P7BQU1_9BACT|nr:SPOR domain-containing protein [Jiulongibacter sediminis]KPM49586.1 hypothetical protein AFM12_03015 [Jiulongibacter sediminis]TBX26625.1 hypothetical protein TK44_03020 [Jiulongibacter sediminis]
MINFEKYIKEALYDFDFFIVPGLGAFIASFAQASMDDSGQVIEPVKSFTFNGLLAKDEEKKFINYVLKKEHKPFSEVELQLKEFTFELKSSLNKNDKVVLANDCIMLYDEDKEILKGEFNSDTNYYTKPDFDQTIEVNLATDVPGESEVLDSIEENQSEEAVEEEDDNIIAPVILDETQEVKNDQQTEVGNDQLSEIEESYDEEYEEAGINWGRYLIYILPLLLIFGGLYYVMLEKPFKKEEEVVSEQFDEGAVVESDSLSSAETSTQDSIVTAVENNTSEPVKYREGRVSEQRKYPFEVAAGLFKSKTNADRLLEKMKNAGFDAEIRLVNDMRRVYVGVNSVEEAEAMSNRIEEFTGLTSVYFDENGVSNK